MVFNGEVTMKYFITILLLVLSISVNAQLIGIASSAGNASGGGPAPNWDLFSESFEGTGYENSWTTGIGTNPGNVIDPDNTDISPPTGGGSQILKMVKTTTPTASQARANIYTGYFTVRPISYTDYYVYVDSHSLAASAYVTVLDIRDGAGAAVFNLSARNLSGELKWYTWIFNNGVSQTHTFPASGAISLDTWYHIQFKYDVTNMMYSYHINGNAVVAETALTGTVRAGIGRIFIGDGTNNTISWYSDLLRISSTNF